MGLNQITKEDALEIIKTSKIEIDRELSCEEINEAFFSRFDELNLAEKEIRDLTSTFSILILVDLHKDKAFIYKAPNVSEIRTKYLPILFKCYEKIGIGPEPFLESINDLTDHPNVFMRDKWKN